MPPVRVAVVGAGAFGRNHLRVYRELEAARPDLITLAALIESDPARRETAATQYNIPTFASVEDFLTSSVYSLLSPVSPFAASVCVPTIHHATMAQQLLHANLDLLIEKPIAATIEQADQICALAEQKQRIVAVGHLERFNPAVTSVTTLLNNPMFFESHRLSIFTPRSLDVDVVLDLMIHDLDIVLSLTNSPIREVRAVGIAILSKKADIANVRVEFASGCVANFTASRVSTEQVRKLRLFQPHQYLSLDFARQELLSIQVDPTAAAANPTHPSAGLALQKLDLPHVEPLRLELENFLTAVQTRTQPRVNATAGRAALALALQITQEIATHAHRTGLA